jgi:hypothetical protein
LGTVKAKETSLRILVIIAFFVSIATAAAIAQETPGPKLDSDIACDQAWQARDRAGVLENCPKAADEYRARAVAETGYMAEMDRFTALECDLQVGFATEDLIQSDKLLRVVRTHLRSLRGLRLRRHCQGGAEIDRRLGRKARS